MRAHLSPFFRTLLLLHGIQGAPVPAFEVEAFLRYFDKGVHRGRRGVSWGAFCDALGAGALKTQSKVEAAAAEGREVRRKVPQLQRSRSESTGEEYAPYVRDG